MIPSADSKFDLIIVDGPPANTPANRHHRSGCLQVVDRWLDNDFILIFDDAERRGEAETIVACRELLLRSRRNFHEGAILAAKRQHVFAGGRFRAAAFY